MNVDKSTEIADSFPTDPSFLSDKDPEISSETPIASFGRSRFANCSRTRYLMREFGPIVIVRSFS